MKSRYIRTTFWSYRNLCFSLDLQHNEMKGLKDFFLTFERFVCYCISRQRKLLLVFHCRRCSSAKMQLIKNRQKFSNTGLIGRKSGTKIKTYYRFLAEYRLYLEEVFMSGVLYVL